MTDTEYLEKLLALPVIVEIEKTAGGWVKIYIPCTKSVKACGRNFEGRTAFSWAAEMALDIWARFEERAQEELASVVAL